MNKLLIFNWKMNPPLLTQARTCANLTRTYAEKTSGDVEIVIAPPFVYLNELKNLKTKKLKNFKIGAQNVFWENLKEKPLASYGAGSGAYTGEISPAMLKNLGVEYVIVGHSERRRKLNETDEMINKKVLAALKAGLKVILCVGEEKRELGIKNYELGIKKAENYIKNQLNKDLKGIHNSLFKIHNSLVIAYEPAWAIGADRSDTPEDAAEIIKYIKQILVASGYTLIPKVLYGGSVSGKNIKDFVKYKEIEGYLIGGASLKSSEVNKIIRICLEK